MAGRPNSGHERLTVHIDSDLVKKIKEQAYIEQRTVSLCVQRIIRMYFDALDNSDVSTE